MSNPLSFLLYTLSIPRMTPSFQQNCSCPSHQNLHAAESDRQCSALVLRIPGHGRSPPPPQNTLLTWFPGHHTLAVLLLPCRLSFSFFFMCSSQSPPPSSAGGPRAQHLGHFSSLHAPLPWRSHSVPADLSPPLMIPKFLSPATTCL